MFLERFCSGYENNETENFWRMILVNSFIKMSFVLFCFVFSFREIVVNIREEKKVKLYLVISLN